MSVKRIIKILGYIFAPILILTIAIYFLFPYLNEEKHQQVAKKYSDDFVVGDTTNMTTSFFSPTIEGDREATGRAGNVKDIGESLARLKEKSQSYQQDIDSLQKEIDSLTTAKDSLKEKLKGSTEYEGETQGKDTVISQEQFSKNIKSLLDLDVENLTPILSKMSNEQLVRMFKAGSGLQQKKLLRSLTADRAAKLMTEVL
ncbi:hypothetical protein [Fodinibius salsisoli]|uniref:Magnesium transporter MgtE intracellular domain-containing protein n=1 Tax=Fodinibius salsisoli TaxID=2820877 RepID=A0ABT3PHI3_9BACT|nr:hypothetical protein [Fodinibius salsisoli]MCW9705375.1 hypothetical protein [Fodinibius salsisoli]